MNLRERQARMYTAKPSTFPNRDNVQPESQPGSTDTALRCYLIDRPDNITMAETNH